jgi:hypothetical protein
MNFKAIQDECISVDGARFAETMRPSVQKWINDRYAEVWGLEDWTFRTGEATITATAGSATASGLPSDFGVVRGIWRDDGEPLAYLRAQDWNGIYLGAQQNGTPEHYKLVNGTLKFGPTPTGTASYTLFYDKKLTVLSADGDVPALPSEYHYMLVHGAIASGSVMVNDFTYQFAEQRWQNAIQGMRAAYLEDVKSGAQQMPAYRL